MGIKDKLKRTSKYFIQESNGNSANGTTKKAPEAEATDADAAEVAPEVEEANVEPTEATSEPVAETTGALESADAEAEAVIKEAHDQGVAAAVKEEAAAEGAAKEATTTEVPTSTKGKVIQAEGKSKADKLAAEGEKAKKDVRDSEPRYKNEKKDFFKRLLTKFKKNKGTEKPVAAAAAAETSEASVEADATKESNALSTEAAKAALAAPQKEVAEPVNTDAAAAATAATAEPKEAQLPEVTQISEEVQAAARAVGEKADEKVAATQAAIGAH